MLYFRRYCNSFSVCINIQSDKTVVMLLSEFVNKKYKKCLTITAGKEDMMMKKEMDTGFLLFQYLFETD